MQAVIDAAMESDISDQEAQVQQESKSSKQPV